MNSLLSRLSYKYKDKGIRNLMYYIAGGMLILFFCGWMANTPLSVVPAAFTFDRALILKGQVWRVLSFIFMPEQSNVFFLLISLYFYAFLGNTLEREWGTFKFNIFYFVGVLGAVIAGFICGVATNTFINLSIFLAFAILFPDFQIMLFFFIPVKMKYLAYFDIAIYGYQLIVGLLTQNWAIVFNIVFSLLNLLLFFGGDFFRGIKNNISNRKRQAEFRRKYNRHD